MKYIILAPLVLAACAGVAEDAVATRYMVGETLMNNCNQRGQDCGAWLDFKNEWNAYASYSITFEDALAKYRAMGY